MDTSIQQDKPTREHEFGLYAGDDFIASGTAKELASRLGTKPEWIRHMSTPTYQRKLAAAKNPTGRAKYTIKLGPSEEI